MDQRAPLGVIVLAGGTSRRFGGGEKTDAVLAGRSVLQHLLAGLPGGADVVVVGPRRPLDGVRWVREEPPGGGPAAAVAAGCAALPVEVEVVAVLAGDQPFAGRAVPRLLAALAAASGGGAAREEDGGTDGAVGVDPGGARQLLLAAYQVASLRAALGTGAADRPVHAVLAGLSVVEVPVDEVESLDVDTAADLDAARRAAAGPAGAAPSSTSPS